MHDPATARSPKPRKPLDDISIENIAAVGVSAVAALMLIGLTQQSCHGSTVSSQVRWEQRRQEAQAAVRAQGARPTEPNEGR